jgi:integrase
MAESKVRLTAERIRRIECPKGRKYVQVRDAEQCGLVLRVGRSGVRTFYAVFRVGPGRMGQVRWKKLGRFPDEISIAEARRRTRELRGVAARGVDPVAEERRRCGERLAQAVEIYIEDCRQRKLVNIRRYESLLRDELLRRFGDVPLTSLDRRSLMNAIDEIERKGQRGKAKEFRTRVAVFLNWSVDRGFLEVSPLAGYRKPRTSRAERLEQPGRALEDREIPLVWLAFEAADDPFFSAYLKFLLLTGQRRGETVRAQWRDFDLDAAVWTIPAETTKSGREHRVPLSQAALEILGELPRVANCELVFPGRGGRSMTGWSKRMRPVQAASREVGLERWTLHDLRRTVRTGLGRLDVPDPVAERILNHAPRDRLQATYDRSDRLDDMREALERWGSHVKMLVARTRDDSRQAA